MGFHAHRSSVLLAVAVCGCTTLGQLHGPVAQFGQAASATSLSAELTLDRLADEEDRSGKLRRLEHYVTSPQDRTDWLPLGYVSQPDFSASDIDVRKRAFDALKLYGDAMAALSSGDLNSSLAENLSAGAVAVGKLAERKDAGIAEKVAVGLGEAVIDALLAPRIDAGPAAASLLPPPSHILNIWRL